jgi:hypothetical protein
LVLKNSSKPMEILRIDENLSFVNEIIVLSNANELAFQPIWDMKFGSFISVLHVVIRINSTVGLDP